MKIIDTKIPEVKIIEPRVFGDDRGFFFESFNQQQFEAAIGYPAQGKLVRCVVGEVFDVAVDIRKSSPTFGQWVGVHLSAENKRQLWIPEGFAHGFVTLSDTAEFLYKTTNYYFAISDRGIQWNDSQLGVAWPIENLTLILSDKDKLQPNLEKAEFFNLIT